MATDPNKALLVRQVAYSRTFPSAPTASALKSQIDTTNLAVAAVEGDVEQLQDDVEALDVRVTAIEESLEGEET